MKTLFSGCLAAAALALSAGAAHAGGVNWSIGINLPPVATVISNGPAYYPGPVYAPAPVYYEPPVVYRPVPRYYAPPPVIYRPVPRYHGPPAVVYRGWDGHRGHRGGYDGPRGRGWDRDDWRGERRHHH